MLNLEQQIFHQLEKAKNILLVFPNDQKTSSSTNHSDALASALALFLFLKKIEKEVEVVTEINPDDKEILSFLPDYTKIKHDLNNLRQFIVSLDISQAKVSQIKYLVDKNQLNFIISPAKGWFRPEDVSTRAGEFQYDLIITLGAADLEALGRLYDDNVEFFYKTAIINIDNHSNNEDFGQINFIDLNAVAVSEIIFYLLKNYRSNLIDEDIATCLLTGIIQQTKNFKTANLTPRTLLSTSELITCGARREEIVDRLYRSRNLNSLKLWGKILNNLKSEKNNELFWSHLSLTEFQDTGATINDLTDIVDELIATVPGAKLITVFCEEDANNTKTIIYSIKNINALDLIKEYSPFGTIKISQAIIKGNLEEISHKIVEELKDKLDKLQS